MSLNNTTKPWLEVKIISPTKEELDSYYEKTGDLKISTLSQKGLKIFKKAKIINSYNEKKYPKESVWMMGESPGMEGNFFGNKIVLIQRKDLYGRIS